LTRGCKWSEDAPAVMVVEHDLEIGGPIVDQLAADGYRVRLGRTAEHARTLARADPPCLVLLGELESTGAALDLLAEIRGGRATVGSTAAVSWPSHLPVIVMSLHTQEPDVLRAFDAGADDFLARPANYLELRARLRALLGRSGNRNPQHVEVGPLRIDLRAHAVNIDGSPLELRRLEYELLLHLAREPERVFAKRELMLAVWGETTPGPTRTLDSHASRLRGKLRAASGECWVVNLRGVGYRLL
jgi:DNA-binding response OmpR family regulator